MCRVLIRVSGIYEALKQIIVIILIHSYDDNRTVFIDDVLRAESRKIINILGFIWMRYSLGQ